MKYSLARPVSSTWIETLLHPTNAAQGAANSDEGRPGTLKKQGIDRLEEIQRPKAVHLDMITEDVEGDAVHPGEVITYACVRNHNVHMIDVVLVLQNMNGGNRVFWDFRVNFDDDEVRTGTGG